MTSEDTRDADVAIVGYGPVGQVLAILLAQRGWRVVVLEKWSTPYTMPRAVSFDGESARILAGAGIDGVFGEIGEPSRDYTWKNAAGDVLLHVDIAEDGYCGWPDSTSMFQPGLEEALADRGAELPGLEVLRGHAVVDLTDRGEDVELVARDAEGDRLALTAAWVVGCDGANSFVRERMGATSTDLGFANDWLTCDVVMTEPREFAPNNLQVCDPARPCTAVSAGPGHRRWEFMRLPDESREEFDDVATAWRLLAPFDVTPDNAVLRRHAVYTFQARFVDRWRAGRLLLAGDAAHLMPPFAGQGMCSGFRDAANAAWKLDLVLRGRAHESLLDTYTVERRKHVQHAITMSVNLGRVICQPDPAAAADRDAAMLANRRRTAGTAGEPAVYQPLTDGLLWKHRDAVAALRGRLVPQGTVAADGHSGPFDDVVGRGFVLMTVDSPERLAPGRLALLADLGAHVVQIVPATEEGHGASAVRDVDEVYLPYFSASGARWVLVRPDFYVFGAVADESAAEDLVGGLGQRLGMPLAV
ncbi:flavoprotein hydroxylase [Herbihabitans rhizosphaerae]|uniref:Flavoprotein hydroxylase n=1 Tax=Herbihabitans rhizosphaerae TaxID=1872711 RepID=A0A4Q7KJG5_9PSEU|nr:bifunctional 3-(3-hydroxy-phenyl)propionate/3-hydroxycinnamic acid hydroxylase [Herbihabitans rhizosphaerae]RZS36324.1 flavoprotein hydroxylase [Herbihabitans rhizosphaerae]